MLHINRPSWNNPYAYRHRVHEESTGIMNRKVFARVFLLCKCVLERNFIQDSAAAYKIMGQFIKFLPCGLVPLWSELNTLLREVTPVHVSRKMNLHKLKSVNIFQSIYVQINIHICFSVLVATQNYIYETFLLKALSLVCNSFRTHIFFGFFLPTTYLAWSGRDCVQGQYCLNCVPTIR